MVWVGSSQINLPLACHASRYKSASAVQITGFHIWGWFYYQYNVRTIKSHKTHLTILHGWKFITNGTYDPGVHYWTYYPCILSFKNTYKLTKFSLFNKFTYISVWVWYGISKGMFEIPHKIFYPYIERCNFYTQRLRNYELSDLWVQTCFWNAPWTWSSLCMQMSQVPSPANDKPSIRSHRCSLQSSSDTNDFKWYLKFFWLSDIFLCSGYISKMTPILSAVS